MVYLRFSRKSAAVLWGYFCLKITQAAPAVPNPTERDISPSDEEIFTGYTSDQTDDDDDNGNRADNEDGGNSNNNGPDTAAEVVPTQEISTFGVTERKRRSTAIEVAIPQPKRRKLEVAARTRRQGQKNELLHARTEALLKIEKMLNVKKSPFEGGHNGLQARRAHAIQGYLHMLARNDCQRIDASKCAAEAQGFAVKWGGQAGSCVGGILDQPRGATGLVKGRTHQNLHTARRP